MKKSLLLLIILSCFSCATNSHREVASEDCKSPYSVNEYNYFKNYEACQDK